jgi:hypothetical protein
VSAVAELLKRVRERGAEVRLGGPTGVEVIRYRLLDGATLVELQQARPDLRRALETEREAIVIVSAQRLLRDCKFPPEPAPCSFHCGRPGEACRRCNAPWAEHYSPQTDRGSPST